MIARHRNIPRLWLMTDERVGKDDLLDAVRTLPRGAGVIFRHYSLPEPERRALFDRVRAIARQRGLVVLVSGSMRQAAAWRADGWHGTGQGRCARPVLHSAPAHGMCEMRAAERAKADLLFLSPVFPTRSHPGAPTLGRIRFAMLARQARIPVIALGGMTGMRAKGLKSSGIYGWAAIDALSGQNPRQHWRSIRT
jgi:thiamine-phosphate pyrophosphorylase